MESNPTINSDENTEAIGKKAKRLAKSKLNEHIAEALQLEREKEAAEARKFTIPLRVGPGWPYWEVGPVSSAVSKEMGQPEDSIREIKWRLKQFRYPYPRGDVKNPGTFYQHAKTLGILELLLKLPLLWDIRFFWWCQKDSQRHNELRREKKSEYGLPTALHHELLFQLSALLTKVEELTEAHDAKKHKEARAWFERIYEYRRATLKELLHEATVVYPQLQYRLIPAKQLMEKAEKVEAQVSLFTKLDSVFKGKGVKSHQFGYHLVSLICTSKEQILKRKLKPTPKTVRRNIEKWMKKHPI